LSEYRRDQAQRGEAGEVGEAAGSRFKVYRPKPD
jgi:hypothetical protein